MNENLKVQGFGPLTDINISIKPLTIFIGEPATGKSALAKLVIIFNEMRDKTDPIDLHKYLIRYNVNNYLQKSYNLNYDSDSKSIIFNPGGFDAKYFNQREITSCYIPAERIFISNISESMMGLVTSDIALPKFLTEFGSKFEKARKEIKELFIDFFNITYKFENGVDTIYINKKEKILLSESASGMQSVIPAILVIEYLLTTKEKLIFALEEPELNLFPSTQKKLVNYLSNKIISMNHSLLITTHSPYILTSFSNLVQARNIYNEQPDIKEQIINIIPEENWIDFENIAAYQIRNGKANDILNYELKTIDANAIDDVSDIIEDEFDDLLKIKYSN